MEDDEEDDIYAPDEGNFPPGKPGGSGTNGKDQDLREEAGSAKEGEASGDEFEEDESDSVSKMEYCVKKRS